ncbi:MAG: BON domain-containing protein [Planctomycetes bacterium]|nr:BON domain-containing protein [Planctomycetota bacterium]
MNRICLFALVCGAALAFATTASAQITGTSSLGSRTIGSSPGSSSTGIGSLDRTSAFSLGTPGTGAAPQRAAATGSLRDILNAGGFNTFGNNAFGQFGGIGGPGLGFNQALGFGRTQFGVGGQNPNQQLNGDNQIPGDLRFRIRTGFTVPRLANRVVAERLSKRLMNTHQLHRLGALTVSLTDRTVTLTGTVASDHARQLAERLVMLEPGVYGVNNELTVATVESPESGEDPGAGLLPLPMP